MLVFTSLATVAIDTFITELSSVIRNCAAASVARTPPAAVAFVVAVAAMQLPRDGDCRRWWCNTMRFKQVWEEPDS